MHSLVSIRVDIFLYLLHIRVHGVPVVLADGTRTAVVDPFLGLVAGATRKVKHPVAVL